MERFCDRISTAQLLEDRREAVLGIRNMSKEYQVIMSFDPSLRHRLLTIFSFVRRDPQVEVGTRAMDHLVMELRQDSSDTEITNLALQTLVNIMTPAPQVLGSPSNKERERKREKREKREREIVG